MKLVSYEWQGAATYGAVVHDRVIDLGGSGKSLRAALADGLDGLRERADALRETAARDWQQHTSQWGPGKNFPGTGAFGPWMVTADEVPDPAQLHLATRVNGEQRQSADVSDLIFSVPALIAYITAFTSLSAGDVIVTGTPAGVGLFRQPPVFLADGDVVEIEISGVGTLRNVVAA